MIQKKIYFILLIVLSSVLIMSCSKDVRFTHAITNKSLGSNPIKITNTNKVTIEGKCDPRSTSVSISGTEIRTTACKTKNIENKPVGKFSFETNEYNTDGPRVFSFSQDIEGETISSNVTWYRDTVPPVVTKTTINSKNREIGRPIASVSASVTDNMDFLKTSTHIQLQEADLANGDCKSKYKENVWTRYSGSSDGYAIILSFFTGDKKVCVWAKDYAGNVSLMNSAGQDKEATDSVFLNIGSIPSVTKLTTENVNTPDGVYTAKSGDLIKVSFSAIDKEGLAANPIDIFYTTDGKTWKPSVKNYGSSPEGEKQISGQYTFTSPSDDFFRIMLVAKDKASNTSYETLSQAFNSKDWSVYAGSNNRGIGQSALSVSLSRSAMASNAFAVDPQNLDIYALDQSSGLVHINAVTGVSSILIPHSGRGFLPDNGPLNGTHRVVSNNTSIKFGNTTGELLISTLVRTLSTPVQSRIIYALNIKTKEVRRLAGGGLDNDFGTKPNNVFMMSGNFALDEDDNIYVHTTCTPGYWDRNNLPEYRLLKIVNDNGQYNKVERIAGGCPAENNGKIEYGKAAFDNHYNRYQYANTHTDLAVWNKGKSIYVSSRGGAKTFKIIDGIIHQTEDSKVTGGLHYSPFNKKLYLTDGPLIEITPNLKGSKGETYKTVIAQQEGPGCTNDGRLANQACVITGMPTGLTQTPHGYLFFADGVNVNRPGYYRVRFLSPDSKIYSMAGHLPFYGDNEDKSVIRSSFAGIHYKTKKEPNQKAFPEGLYFVDKDAAAFGYINPKTRKANVLAGNQSRIPGVTKYAKDKPMSKLNTMGYPYYGGSMFPLVFDDEGLPWTRTENFVTHIDKNHIVRVYSKTDTHWQFAKQGDSVTNLSMWPYGGRGNFSMSGKGIFLLGSYEKQILGPYYEPNPILIYLDYATNKVTHVMGGTGRSSSPDSTTTGDVSSKSIDKRCVNYQCSTYFDRKNDILYFSELDTIRAIKNPLEPSKAVLTTLNLPELSITQNNSYKSFILSNDKKQIYVVVGGSLKCYDLVGKSKHCNGQNLGPSLGLGKIYYTANQLSWKTDKELLVSTFRGTILRYKVPQ